MRARLKTKAQLAKNNPVVNGTIIVNSISINKYMEKLLGKIVDAEEQTKSFYIGGWYFPKECVSKIIEPMTKKKELAIIKKAMMDLGKDSYIGPWLKSNMPYLESCLKADYLPTEEL